MYRSAECPRSAGGLLRPQAQAEQQHGIQTPYYAKLNKHSRD